MAAERADVIQVKTGREGRGRAERRDGWLLAGSLAASLLVYAFVSVAGAGGQQTETQAFVVIAIGSAAWLVFAVLQVMWWLAGKAKFWRPPYGVLGFFFLVASLIGIPTLLIPRWRRWLFRMMKPYDDPVVASLRRLDDVRAAGALTETEYEARKSEILSRL